MKIKNLLVSGVSISEYEYDYKGFFLLSCENTGCTKNSIKYDLAQFESDDNLVLSAKDYFNIEEGIKDIRKEIINKVLEKASLNSKNVQGETYGSEDNPHNQVLDRA